MNKSGGNLPIYLSNIMIRFDDNSKLSEDESFGIDGTLVDLTLIKSRLNKAGKTATLVFNQSTGYDPELSLLVLLKEHKRIGGAGRGFFIGDNDEYKFSQKTFKEKLRECPEMQELLAIEAIQILKTYLYDESSIVQETQHSFDITDMILNKVG